jgi:sterol desaturase/sphingolipid hydroxylase (fatty acid hydroxylase superfamily)
MHPKYFLLITLFFLPTIKENIFQYLASSSFLCLILFSLFSFFNSQVILTTQDKCIILCNLTVTYIYIYYFILFNKNIYNLNSILEVPLKELIYIIFWVILHECIFFTCHKFMHSNKYLYKIHKVHHKFKITNVWTSFYFHPLDNLFIIVAATVIPQIMLYLNYKISATSVSLYLNLAGITFLSSHHAYTTQESHILHHEKINVNYGNFWFLDYLNKSNN